MKLAEVFCIIVFIAGVAGLFALLVWTVSAIVDKFPFGRLVQYFLHPIKFFRSIRVIPDHRRRNQAMFYIKRGFKKYDCGYTSQAKVAPERWMDTLPSPCVKEDIDDFVKAAIASWALYKEEKAKQSSYVKFIQEV